MNEMERLALLERAMMEFKTVLGTQRDFNQGMKKTIMDPKTGVLQKIKELEKGAGHAIGAHMNMSGEYFKLTTQIVKKDGKEFIVVFRDPKDKRPQPWDQGINSLLAQWAVLMEGLEAAGIMKMLDATPLPGKGGNSNALTVAPEFIEGDMDNSEEETREEPEEETPDEEESKAGPDSEEVH
jgi:hypothetical protein